MKKQLIYFAAICLFLFPACEPDLPGGGGTGPVIEAPKKPPYQPNIIFFLIDDIGLISTPPYSSVNPTDTVWQLDNNNYWDPKLPKAVYSTDTIFQFAQQATRLNQMYATPSCAPSRAQLLTGLYPCNTGITFPAWGDTTPATPQVPNGYLDTTILTYANQLQDLGYTTGFGGKYNLRYGLTEGSTYTLADSNAYNLAVYNQQQHLIGHGFDETFGPSTWDSNGYYTGGKALIGNTVDYFPPFLDGFFPDTLHQWAMEFVQKHESGSDPYYLHYCFGMIHDYNLYAELKLKDPAITQAEVFAMKVHLVDSMIKEVLALVDPDSTLVIIAGDNGTESFKSSFGPGYATAYHGTGIPGGKLTMESHGSRVPFMLSWPGVIKTNNDYDEMVDFADVFGTMVELAGGQDTFPSLNGNSFLYQISNDSLGTDYTPRKYVYSQLQGQGFVASIDTLMLVDNVYNPQTVSWYDISSSPYQDQFLDSTSVDSCQGNPMWSYFEELGTIGLCEKSCP